MLHIKYEFIVGFAIILIGDIYFSHAYSLICHEYDIFSLCVGLGFQVFLLYCLWQPIASFQFLHTFVPSLIENNLIGKVKALFVAVSILIISFIFLKDGISGTYIFGGLTFCDGNKLL